MQYAGGLFSMNEIIKIDSENECDGIKEERVKDGKAKKNIFIQSDNEWA